MEQTFKTKDGEVIINVLEDGTVKISGASKIQALFPYRDFDEEMEIVDPKSQQLAGVLRVDIEMPGCMGGLEAIFHEDGHAIKDGRQRVLGLEKKDGMWEVNARDGVGSWHKLFVL